MKKSEKTPGNKLLNSSTSSNGYIFLDKSKQPSDHELAKLTPDAFKFISDIRAYLALSGIIYIEEWKYYSKQTGWTKKLLVNKRNVFFFTPKQNEVSISFVFGDKAVEEINRSSLPRQIKEEISGAKKYMEGRGLRIQVKNKNDLENVITLIHIKLR